MDSSVAKIEFFLLGSWQLRDPAGPTKKELRRKEQALLAYLAVESGQTHSRDSLVGLFWPDMSTSDARNNLRVALSRLKKHLSGSDLLETTRHTVAFIPRDQVQLDVSQFLALIKQTEEHDHRSIEVCPQCLDRLNQAVNLYHGEFLTGFFLDDCLAFEEWLFVWRERLHVQMLKQLDQLVQAAEDNGQFENAEGYARRQIELDPLHENAHRQLMRALYAQGQRNAALNQFQKCETIFRNELGVEPDVETVLLRQEIQASTLDISSFLSGDASQIAGYALPEITTPFIGREAELDQLSQRLTERSYRLISLVGPGGIGKTRLAIQAARAQRDTFRDGVYFVPLEGVQKATEIPAAIAEAVGITFTANFESPRTEIVQILHSKQLLLVIDNLEHLIDEGADLLLDLIRTVPEMVLLVTSRERINAQGEDLFRLRGLPYPETLDDVTAAHFAAIRLFGDRAHRLNKSFGLNEDTLPHVVRICHLVEGLPLGLELAATWIRDFTAEKIADAIEKNLDLLETDLRDIEPRHQSIQAVFDYSWKQLSEAEQQILPLLTIFKGGFSLLAASIIAGASPIILTRLRYKSLLRSEGSGRYSLHELLRQIAAQELPETIQSIQANYYRYYFQLLREKTPVLKGCSAREAGQTLMMEIDNIRQAWHWGIEAKSFADLKESVPFIAEFYTYNGLLSEGIALIDAVLQELPAEEEKRPFFLIEKACLMNEIEGLAEVELLIDQILHLTTGLTQYQAVRARAYYYLSKSLFVKSIDSNASLDYAQQAMVLAKQLDDNELIAQLYNQLGSLHYRFEQTEEALQEINKALSIYESLGNVKGIAQAYDKLGKAYSESGDLIKALETDITLLDIYQEMGAESKIADQTFNLAVMYSSLGAYQKAESLIKTALDLFYKINDEIGVQVSFIVLGENAYCLGEDEISLDYFRKGIKLQEKLQLQSRLCNDLTGFSLPLRRIGSLDEAQQVLEKAIDTSVAPRYKLQAEAHLACVFLDQGKNDEAFTLAKAVWEEIKIDEAKSLPDVLRTLSHLYEVFDTLDYPQLTQPILALAFSETQHILRNLNDPEILDDFLKFEPNLQFFRPAFVKQGYVLPV